MVRASTKLIVKIIFDMSIFIVFVVYTFKIVKMKIAYKDVFIL